ncbi:putative ribosome biogenesis protein [Neofusicoccum parvum UCRNP2]|uniref:Putative ribosome biogenesis protein n=1 Tax=Botryosphaeria parva (strain UCR-NP2) TaxID=1287680 RepID=R1GQG5_BOTPV|nr:putative ribosome biogenesis protein [Neofusicoccum parvum UCRNP2]
MGPHRKRQRLSEDGKSVAVSSADVSPPITAAAASDAQKSVDDGDHRGEQASKHRRQLFVRGLGTATTIDDLTDHFSQSFPIKHAVAVLDKETKQCKGYGFVTFADAEDAARAREEFDGSDLQGRKIKVDIAESRHRDVESGVSQPAKAAVEAKKRKDEQMAPGQSKLIIRNLPWSIKTEDQLTKMFLSYGKVKATVLPKKKNGMLAGYGFVTLRGRKNAEKALEAVNGKEIDGRALAVDWSVDKETWQKVQDDAAQENGESADEDDDKAAQDEGEDDEDDDVEDEEDDEDSEDEEDDDDEERYIDEEEEQKAPRTQNFYGSSTLFIRNLPFTCTDEDLEEHFEQFGGVRYARIVIDRATEKPKGTGFVCFYKEEDAIACLKGAPKQQHPQNSKDKTAPITAHSVLQNTEADPTGQYTIEGRVLNITMAVDRSQAERLTAEGVAHRYKRDNDKRKLYLLSEGTIASNSPLYQLLSPAEIQLRDASVKQRKNLIESNPSLSMSLTRLSIRNIPRTVSSKDLKQLARQAIVGFATDMKAGKRSPLSHEELRRGDAEMREADKERKKKGKGVVRQAKIVFENKDGSKVSENTGAGRSRGYGFVEYYSHRHALMGLRWLNGHAIDYKALETQKGKKLTPEDIKDRKKRLIVEFAIENAQVVQRRRELEAKMREKTQKKATEGDDGSDEDGEEEQTPRKGRKGGKFQKNGAKGAGKRKRGQDEDDGGSGKKKNAKSADPKDEKLAKQSRIIARKRQMRRARDKGTKR